MFSRTDRLLLRPAWNEDVFALASAIGHDEVVRNLFSAPCPYGPDDAHAYLHRLRTRTLPDFLAFARTGGAPRLIGGCAITRRPDARLELGFWIARPYWGLGFATEAAHAVMHIARSTGITPVHAAPMLDNPASIRVLRKLGFAPTGASEQRWSMGRDALVPCMVMVDTADTIVPEDTADLLYKDRPLIAA